MNLKNHLAGSFLAVTALVVQAAGSDSFYGATLQLQDGKPLVVETLRGKPLAVAFWERDCEVCVAQNAELAKAENQLRPNGLKVLGILIDKRAESLEDSTKPVKSPLTTAVTDFRKGLWLMQNLGNPGGGVPFVVIFDRNGQIVSRSKGLFTTMDMATALATPPK